MPHNSKSTTSPSPSPAQPLPPVERRCNGVTKDGHRCKAYAVEDGLCAVHLGRNHPKGGAPAGNENALRHGFYSEAFTTGELAQLISYADDLTLDDEISAARVTNARLLMFTLQHADEMNGDELGRLVVAQMRGLKTVADLLRAKRAISGEAGDGIAGAIAAALDEIGNQWGVEL